MAKKPVNIDETKQVTVGGITFVNYDFSDKDRANFRKWAEVNNGYVWDTIDKLLDSGYQISLKDDTYNKCRACFISCKNEKSPNSGMILTGRGSTPIGALLGALYRHLIIFQEIWPTDNTRRAALDDD